MNEKAIKKQFPTSHFLFFHYFEDVIEHTEVLYETWLNFLLY